MAAAQDDEYAAHAVERLSRPHMVRQKKNLHALRAVRSISQSVGSLGKEYECRINELKEEFQYEQEREMEMSESRGQ